MSFHRICSWWLVAFALISASAGCSPTEEPVDQVDDVPQQIPKLVLAIVGEEDLAVEIERYWRNSMDGELETKVVSGEKFAENEFASIDGADVVIYPAGFKLDLIAARKLQAIPQHLLDDEEFNQRELFSAYRGSLVEFDGERFAVSLGEPRPALFYRQDIFSQFNIDQPTTWKEYDAAVKEIARLREQEPDPVIKQSLHAVEMSRGDGLARNFVIRAAPYTLAPGRYSTFFDVRTMDANIDTVPFVRALEELAAVHSAIDYQSPEAAYRSILDGKAAMAITWPAAKWSQQSTEGEISEPLPIMVKPLPAADNRYDYSRERWVPREPNPILIQGMNGNLASVLADSKHATTAKSFVVWLASKETSTRLRSDSANNSATRASHLGNVVAWLGDDLPAETKFRYADIVQETCEANIRLDWFMLPHANEYVDSLNAAIDQVINGEMSSGESLAALKQQWNAITETHTQTRQRRFYRGAMGL